MWNFRCLLNSEEDVFVRQVNPGLEGALNRGRAFPGTGSSSLEWLGSCGEKDPGMQRKRRLSRRPEAEEQSPELQFVEGPTRRRGETSPESGAGSATCRGQGRPAGRSLG